MARASSLLTQSEAKRVFLAAFAAGAKDVSLIIHPDRRMEFKVSTQKQIENTPPALDQWRRLNGKS